MMAGFDLARETFLWWGVWVLESAHFEAGTRTLLGYDMRRKACWYERFESCLFLSRSGGSSKTSKTLCA